MRLARWGRFLHRWADCFFISFRSSSPICEFEESNTAHTFATLMQCNLNMRRVRGIWLFLSWFGCPLCVFGVFARATAFAHTQWDSSSCGTCHHTTSIVCALVMRAASAGRSDAREPPASEISSNLCKWANDH